MSVRILIGDCRSVLRTLPDESVHVVVTSPPYFGLRDYGVAGQIGLEQTPDEYVAEMVAVFRDVRRVLRSDGTCWLNLGDSYAGNRSYQVPDSKHGGHDFGSANASKVPFGFKPKDLMMIPARVALALQADGWWIRSEIVWHKPNPMPESTRDRPTSAHEKVYLLSKSARYFYDAEAVKEALAVPGWDDGTRVFGGANKAGANAKHARTTGRVAGRKRGLPPRHAQHPESSDQSGLDEVGRGQGRNMRNVWAMATRPYAEAHFATFPPDLPERCIRAGTSERGCCPSCGAPWVRQTEREDSGWDGSRYGERAVEATGGAKNGGTARSTLGSCNGRLTGKAATTGWAPSCGCPPADPVPATVLDPFGGAGTTGLVADRLQRDAILIELNPEYAEMARRRIAKDARLFTEIAS